VDEVEYWIPAAPLQTDAGPVILGVFGSGFTVTLYGIEFAEQENELVTVRFTV